MDSIFIQFLYEGQLPSYPKNKIIFVRLIKLNVSKLPAQEPGNSWFKLL